jgi:hypothetical protein
MYDFLSCPVLYLHLRNTLSEKECMTAQPKKNQPKSTFLDNNWTQNK